MIERIVICLCAACIAACASSGDPKKAAQDYRGSAATYVPLAVGNQWTYTVDYLGQLGEMTIEIVQQEGEWFVDNRGTMLSIDHRGVRDRERYLITFPLQENRSWVAFTSPTQRETRTVLTVDMPVDTPAGHFEGAVAIETAIAAGPDMLLKSVHYFVPKVGIVKIETFIEDARNGEVKRQTLTLLKNWKMKDNEKN